MRLGYLTGVYARASDSFVRGEVLQLRQLGHEVQTFSVRRPSPGEAIDEHVDSEQKNTTYLLDLSFVQLFAETFAEALHHPFCFLKVLRLAYATASPGLKGHLVALAYVVEAAALARRIRSRGIQHLHNHMGFNSAAVATLASLLAGIPFSLTIHGPDEFDRPEQLALREKIARARFTIAISSYGRSQLMRWSPPEHWSKIHVVRCGVDPVFLNEQEVAVPEAKRFVCVGRLAEAKGFQTLVEAMKLVTTRHIEATVDIIGDGPLRGILQQEIIRQGLDSAVRLVGWQSAGFIRNAILNSRALLLPSFAEGLPVVIMESLALHRPVVATCIAGIPELVRHGENGWLVAAGSADEFARAIIDASLRDPADLLRMGRAGAEAVRREHDPLEQARKLSRLFGTPETPECAGNSHYGTA